MAIDTVVEEVATNLEEAAQVTRSLNKVGIKYFIGGLVVGAAVGFYFGRRWNKEKLKLEAFEESKKEVDEIRDDYRMRLRAMMEKPPIEDIVEEKGYERPLPAPVPITEPVVTSGPIVDYTPPKEVPVREQDIDWNWPEELQGRDNGGTYILHQDEFGERNKDGFKQVTYTYYAEDGVLVDEDESRMPFTVIGGPENLKFGHGSDDEDVVFIRNEKLEIDIELCQSPKSWEEEVLGLQNEEN